MNIILAVTINQLSPLPAHGLQAGKQRGGFPGALDVRKYYDSFRPPLCGLAQFRRCLIVRTIIHADDLEDDPG